MPIQEGVLIACKEGVVEMTATISDPHKDEAESFAHAAAAKIYAHQYQAMTDVAIIDPPNLAISSCLLCRDPLSAPLKDALISLGFTPIDTEAGGSEERSMFSRFQKPRRSRLEKWRTMFMRASDVSPKLGELEDILIEEVPEGTVREVSSEASTALINAARTSLKILLAPNFECIGQLERLIGQERASRKGRLVFHPAVVRAIAGFVSETLIHAAPKSRWSDDPDDESPLHVEAPRGSVVRTDPEFRVVNFVIKGSKELLSSYIESVLRQSLTAARQT